MTGLNDELRSPLGKLNFAKMSTFKLGLLNDLASNVPPEESVTTISSRGVGNVSCSTWMMYVPGELNEWRVSFARVDCHRKWGDRPD